MTTPLRNPLFLLCLIGLIIIYAIRMIWPGESFIKSYGIDFCAMVVFLTVSLVILRVSKGDSYLQMNATRIISTVILYAFWMEFIIPFIWSQFKSDPWDIIAYAFGALAFSTFINFHGPKSD